jgi:hypothetical protein
MRLIDDNGEINFWATDAGKARRAGTLHQPTPPTPGPQAGPVKSTSGQFFHGCLAADPKKAHPRISITSGMPNAMIAHISSFAHGTSAWDLMSL